MDRRLPRDEDRLAPDRHLTGLAERRRVALVALIALAAFAALAVWARYYSPASFEPGLLSAVSLREGPLDDAWRVVNTLGNLPIWLALLLPLTLVVAAVRGAAVAALVALSALADGVAAVVKLIVERGRPDSAIVEGLFGPDAFAFPSGHVVRAVALAAALAWVVAPPHRRLSLALLAAIVAGAVMGYARVALGVHWPTDALGGLLLGIGWFALTVLALARTGTRRAA